VHITDVQGLLEAARTRASVGPALLFAYFRPVYRQGRRSLTLAKKRFAEQMARSVLDMALFVELQERRAMEGIGPPLLYPKARWAIGAFSDKTRMRQKRERWPATHRQMSWLLKDLVLVNGSWTRSTRNAGMGRLAGTFPRKEITSSWSAASLTAAHHQRLTNFFSCVIDEYRTSKQLHKLWALLDDTRRDKTTPKVGTTAYTTSNKTPGKIVEFTVAQQKHKLQTWTSRDGTTRVGNRDEGTVETYDATYVHAQEGKARPTTISRKHIKAAQTSGRSRKARDASRSGF